MPIPDDEPCRLRAELRRAIADDTDPVTTAALAAHLETCPHCQQADLAVTSLLSAYGRRMPEPLDAEREAHLLACMCGPALRTDPITPPDSLS